VVACRKGVGLSDEERVDDDLASAINQVLTLASLIGRIRGKVLTASVGVAGERTVRALRDNRVFGSICRQTLNDGYFAVYYDLHESAGNVWLKVDDGPEVGPFGATVGDYEHAPLLLPRDFAF